ncbi:hypothetical protein F2Q68_00040990 [Brassica cretica]|uniref:VQ domain-containing protein n=1 Tax=Brassica cretica TaxID=69181 RepID=A0A8S9MM66_BRACR|nr:hypothetical protein F2Q68_00040990 [Brassica cretica]
MPPRRIFHTPNENYKSLVQRITGKPPTSTTPSSSSYTSSAPNYTSAESPAMEMYAELEKTKPTDQCYHHQNRDNQRPNLSPGSSSLPSTTSPQGLLSSSFSRATISFDS